MENKKYIIPDDLENYTEGMGCQCGAHASIECGCDVDWTPKEVYELQSKINDLTPMASLAEEIITKKRDWLLSLAFSSLIDYDITENAFKSMGQEMKSY